MLDETRLEARLAAVQQELKGRPLVPGVVPADAFTLRGVDERGNLGLFAVVLLRPGVSLDFAELATVRQALVLRLKQITAAFPAWPIVVHGAPEVVDGQHVPGGREFFEQLKAELKARPIPPPRTPPGARPAPVSFPALTAEAGKRTIKPAGKSPRTTRASRR